MPAALSYKHSELLSYALARIDSSPSAVAAALLRSLRCAGQLQKQLFVLLCVHLGGLLLGGEAQSQDGTIGTGPSLTQSRAAD